MKTLKMILLLTVLILPSIRTAWGTDGKKPEAVEIRQALVIGNAAYESSPPANTLSDARKMAETLRRTGFSVTDLYDINYKEMNQAIDTFGKNLLKGGAGLFYFSGYGIQYKGKNYLLPVNADIQTENNIPYRAVDTGLLLAKMEYAGNRMNMVILDACRENPFTATFQSPVSGLAALTAPAGTLIAYSVAPGSAAFDQTAYVSELTRLMQVPGLTAENIFREVREAMIKATDNQQVPWNSGSIENFYFIRNEQEKSGYPAAGQSGEKTDSKPSLSPFNRHEDRYQHLAEVLVKGGMKTERIYEIFSSDRSKEKDEFPVQRMATKVSRSASMRPEKQIWQITARIRKHLAQYKTSYDRLEKRYGVNREIAAAILFKETSLGNFKNWKHESFTVLNSILGFMDIPEDADDIQKKRLNRIISTAGDSLAGLLLYCHAHDVDILQKQFPSSFAGALGIPQFMPMYMDYAVTDSGKLPDLSHMPDAILSLGNLLKNRFAWPGMMDLEKLGAIDDLFKGYVEFDKQKGVSFCMTETLEGEALRPFVKEAVNEKVPHLDYIAGYAKVLMDYNYSSAYVLDVLQLSWHSRTPADFSPDPLPEAEGSRAEQWQKRKE